jgi:hypothetical protein
MKKKSALLVLVSILLTACGSNVPAAIATPNPPAPSMPMPMPTIQEPALYKAPTCLPGVVYVDPINDGDNLMVSNWIEWPMGEPVVGTANIEGDHIVTFYKWTQDSNTISAEVSVGVPDQKDSKIIEIPIGHFTALVIFKPIEGGSLVIITYVVFHCGENSWVYSEDLLGRYKTVPVNTYQRPTQGSLTLISCDFSGMAAQSGRQHCFTATSPAAIPEISS